MCSPKLREQIFDAIFENSIENVETLLQSLEPAQRKLFFFSTLHGHSPLSFAIKHNLLEMSLYLLEHSLRLGRSNLCKFWKSCRHPLKTAVFTKNIKLVRMIAQNMDDIDDYPDGVYSPLMLTILTGDIEYVKIMIRLGADVNRPCSNNSSPLMSSVLSDDICRFLIYHGACLNHKDNDGFTALHVAATLTNTNCLNFLINAGADLSIQSNEGLTPIMFAATLINVAAVSLLSQLPAYTDLEKIEALEVLSACLVCGQKPMLELWILAVELRKNRYPKKVLPAMQIFDFNREFHTETDLQKLQNDPLTLAFQSILVIERILGRNNSVYLRVLLQTAQIAKESRNMQKVWQLIEYIEQYCLLAPASLIMTCATYFQTLFTVIVRDPVRDNIYDHSVYSLLKMIVNVTKDMWVQLQKEYFKDHRFENFNFTEVVNAFLYMTSVIKQVNLSPDI